MKTALIQLTAPLPHHDRGDAVADEVGDRDGLSHEAVNAEDQGDACDGDDAGRGNRAGERDERRSATPAAPFDVISRTASKVSC